MKRFGLVFLGFTLLASEARAWGDIGHRVVCEIALQQVSVTTRSQIDALIRSDSEFTSFSDACTWPDHPRKRAAEHFLNLPRTSRGLTANDCGGTPSCVVSAIEQDAAALASKTTTQAEKLASLKYLGHWVGDVHQPLHVSFEDDRGGNSIRTNGVCHPNLHSAWDTCLVSAAVGDNPLAAAAMLLKSLSPAQAQAWTQSSPKDWANESFAISERPETHYCHFIGNACVSNDTPLNIDQSYIQENAPIVRAQLLKAGVRLGHLLDVALAPH